MTIQDLSDDEVQMVLRSREDAAKEAERLCRRLRLLQAAARYEQWLQEHARGSSFSTFVNEFDGQADMYESVQAIRALVGAQ